MLCMKLPAVQVRGWQMELGQGVYTHALMFVGTCPVQRLFTAGRDSGSSDPSGPHPPCNRPLTLA